MAAAESVAEQIAEERAETDIAPQSAPVTEEFVKAMAAESKAELVLIEYKESTLHALEGLHMNTAQGSQKGTMRSC